MVELKIKNLILEIEESELEKLTGQAPPVMCPGASTKSTAVPAFMTVEKNYRRSDNHRTYWQRAVQCPRIRETYEGGSSRNVCYEGAMDELAATEEKHDHTALQEFLKDCLRCPYHGQEVER
ncbi:hypothetical protein KY362_02135 [Candidatus Woesearchaeota archaeon]|nr:hypothetical protein [Candidatus Woesearchaeota archaeon]